MSLLLSKNRLALAAGALALVTALPAAAQWRNAEAAIKYRQSAMSLQGNHMARLFAMANGQVPFDAKVAAEQIDIVATLNRLQFAAFIDGSDKGNTRAKPEIWAEKDKFKAAAGAVGQSCKACHDAYQKPQ
jgi:cytochrome c556